MCRLAYSEQDPTEKEKLKKSIPTMRHIIEKHMNKDLKLQASLFMIFLSKNATHEIMSQVLNASTAIYRIFKECSLNEYKAKHLFNLIELDQGNSTAIETQRMAMECLYQASPSGNNVDHMPFLLETPIHHLKDPLLRNSAMNLLFTFIRGCYGNSSMSIPTGVSYNVATGGDFSKTKPAVTETIFENLKMMVKEGSSAEKNKALQCFYVLSSNTSRKAVELTTKHIPFLAGVLGLKDLGECGPTINLLISKTLLNLAKKEDAKISAAILTQEQTLLTNVHETSELTTENVCSCIRLAKTSIQPESAQKKQTKWLEMMPMKLEVVLLKYKMIQRHQTQKE